jgi:L-lactate dehydrogenase complex protein LldG
MTSRDSILSAVRRVALPSAALPRSSDGITFADPVQKFAETLAAVGGRCVREDVHSLDVYQNARRIVSCVEGTAQTDDPHDLADVDLAIIRGEFGVAENAAVWVPGENLGPHRAVFVIAQHLVLLVPAGAIVHNMKQAYERVRVSRGGFGVFISGPSKTADIEQSLVIGAHGPRSCTVVLIEDDRR